MTNLFTCAPRTALLCGSALFLMAGAASAQQGAPTATAGATKWW